MHFDRVSVEEVERRLELGESLADIMGRPAVATATVAASPVAVDVAAPKTQPEAEPVTAATAEPGAGREPLVEPAPRPKAKVEPAQEAEPLSGRRWAAWPERLAIASFVVAVGSAALTTQSASAATPVPLRVSQEVPSASPAAVIASPPPAPAPPAPATPAGVPPKPAPTPKPATFVAKLIQIAIQAAPGADAQAAADRCIGPVEYRWGDIPPIVVEHNYCGGYGLVNVRIGQTVNIAGGDIAGTYVVAGRHYISAYGSMSDVKSSWGDVILATCSGNSTEVAVGLTRVG